MSPYRLLGIMMALVPLHETVFLSLCTSLCILGRNDSKPLKEALPFNYMVKTGLGNLANISKTAIVRV